MVDLMMHPLDGAHWVILLACVRVMSVFGALFALQYVTENRKLNPTANFVLICGLALLAFGQLIGALGLNADTSVTPTAFAFIANIGATVVCLGIYIRGATNMRR